MKKITLTHGLFADVDDEDFGVLSAYHWAASTPIKGKYYAFRNLSTEEKFASGKAGASCLRVYLHREVIKAPNRIRVRIIDNNPLNCCKYNLELIKPSFSLTEKIAAQEHIRPIIPEKMWHDKSNSPPYFLHPHRGIFFDDRRDKNSLIGNYLVKRLNVGPSYYACLTIADAVKRVEKEDWNRRDMAMPPVWGSAYPSLASPSLAQGKNEPVSRKFYSEEGGDIPEVFKNIKDDSILDGLV